jgi:DNA ligase D-like protein (predicted ligase)
VTVDQLRLALHAFPTAVRPMQPMFAEASFHSPDYLFEVKWEGIRCIVLKTAGGIRLQDRTLGDITGLFPEMLEAASQIAEGSVLDGELVMTDSAGRPDRHRLRNRLRGLPDPGPIAYLAFDLLYAEGRPLLRQPLSRRRARLRRMVAEGSRIIVPEHIETEGVDLFEACLERGLEGIVAKHRESPYIPGQRSPFWLAIKAVRQDDFVIVGATPGQPFGALLVAHHEGGRLLPCGSVGGGYDLEMAQGIARRLSQLATPNCPLEPQPIVTGEVAWVRPELVISVRYSEWAPDGTLRFPIFDSLSPRTHPSECVRHRPRVVIEGRARPDGPAYSLTQFPF